MFAAKEQGKKRNFSFIWSPIGFPLRVAQAKRNGLWNVAFTKITIKNYFIAGVPNARQFQKRTIVLFITDANEKVFFCNHQIHPSQPLSTVEMSQTRKQA